jgi:transposase InsO family protein
MVNCNTYPRKKELVKEGEVSGGQTQQEIDCRMKEITAKHSAVFEGLGRAKVDPIHIEVDPNIKPVKQKERRIALHYKEKFKEHLKELKEAGVVSGPLGSEEAVGWVSNVVITHKSWTDKKIRVNLDTRPMAEAIKAAQFPIPTPMELRHEFTGSDRYSQIDLNHAFHQFSLDDQTKDIFKFYTPWGLHRFNTLVMGVSSGSSECHEKLRVILEGLEGVIQIKDDIVVHGCGKEHDTRLEALLVRLEKFNITLRKEKCNFGQQEVKWFGNTYTKQGMSPDPEKVAMIKAWPRPEDKAAVKSFLQTVQFCQIFMRPGKGRTYSDVTKPLRELTAKSERFVWTDGAESSFKELKELLISDSVMANYDPKRETKLFVDDGPSGVAATVAQKYEVKGLDHPGWRPVAHNSRAKTEAEMNYSKVEGESLAILSGIMSNKMYLYGTKFTVATDHQALVPLYKSHSKELPVRVARHKSKLRAFNFVVKYEAGVSTPADYGSRHHAAAKNYSEMEKENLGVEDMEEDAEIVVNRVEALTEAVTLPVLKKYSLEDEEMQKLSNLIKKDAVKCDMSGYKECFAELSLVDGLVVRGERLLIPAKLRADVLEAAHEGHPGTQSMVRQLRQDTWWPGQSRDVRDFVDSCLACTASVGRTSPAPMTVRETPTAAWQHCSADFKGPIGGQFYCHVLIDNYSRWPEVEIVNSTSLEDLKPALDRSLDLFGIPLSVTHDNGPCYNSLGWRQYARERGFELRPCTPEHPEGNAIAERFMSVLVKVIHTAVVEGRDPRQEVRRRLLNYRNTPHPSTGKTPAQLMMNRRPRTRIPSLLRPELGKVHQEAQEMDRETREKRKEVFDKRKRAVKKEVKPGDKVLIKQQKTTLNPPYDPKPYIVEKVKEAQVTASKGSKVRVRDMSRLKVVKERPEHLQAARTAQVEETDSEDEDYLDIRNLHPRLPVEQEQQQEQQEEQEVVAPEEQEQEVEGPEVNQPVEQEEEAPQGAPQEEQEQGVRRGKRLRKPPKRHGDMVPWEDQEAL